MLICKYKIGHIEDIIVDNSHRFKGLRLGKKYLKIIKTINFSLKKKY